MARYSSAAAEDSAVAIASAAKLDEMFATNGSGSTRFLQIFDSATLPANGAVPLACIALKSETTGGWDPEGGRHPDLGSESFSNGIVVALSSTFGTLTVTTASEALFVVRYRAG